MHKMFKFQDSDDFLFIENVRRTIKMKMKQSRLRNLFQYRLDYICGNRMERILRWQNNGTRNY